MGDVSNKYRKKPVVIEAVQVNGTTKQDDEIREWTDGAIKGHWSNKSVVIDNGGHKIIAGPRHPGRRIDGVIEYNIRTLEGTMLAEYGDWIIKGVKGEFYPCKPDIFEQTYEVADHPEPFTSSVDSLMQQEIEAVAQAERNGSSRILEGVLATVSLQASDEDRRRMNELPARIRGGE